MRFALSLSHELLHLHEPRGTQARLPVSCGALQVSSRKRIDKRTNATSSRKVANCDANLGMIRDLINMALESSGELFCWRLESVGLDWRDYTYWTELRRTHLPGGPSGALA